VTVLRREEQNAEGKETTTEHTDSSSQNTTKHESREPACI